MWKDSGTRGPSGAPALSGWARLKTTHNFIWLHCHAALLKTDETKTDGASVVKVSVVTTDAGQVEH